MRRLGSSGTGITATARTLGLIAVATAFIFTGATPAFAVGEIQVSSDGGFSSESDDPLFASVGSMVPLDSQNVTFRVRNAGDQPGYLRISVADVASTDQALEDALTLKASVAGFPGSFVALSSATPCRVLTEGYILEPNQSITVRSTLALGDLDGQTAQGAQATFRFHVGLSDTAPGSIVPTRCTPNSSVVPGTPDTPNPQPDPGPNPGPNPVDQPDGTPVTEPSAAPTTTPTPAPEPPAFVWPAFPTFDLDTNTVRLFQDWGALVPGLAFVLGAGWFLFVARRRKKKEEEEEDEDDDSDFEESYVV